jgi:uncharacterized protein
MPAVSDASPIIGLATIGHLELLHEQFGTIFIPPGVQAELKIETGFLGTTAIQQAMLQGWLQTKAAQNIPLVQALMMELHAGEAEALALASYLCLEVIVMDEHDGRIRAKAMGLNPVGILGILLRAKRMGRIDSLVKAMESLRREVGFFIAENLYQQILQQAGEK